MAKGISVEAFVPEMRRMREEGMSNHAIAQSLGIAIKTVYSYIGPQPKGIRRKPVYGGQPKPYREPASEPKDEYPACLVVVDREIALEGTVGHYSLTPKHKIIKICMEDGSGMRLDFDKFKAFVDEVNAINRKLDELKIENEMW